MKRIVLWLLSTLSIVVLLFGYDTSTSGVQTASPTSIISGGSSAASQSTSTGSSKSGSNTGSKSGSGSASKSSTATGDTVATQWGPVQVELTVKAGTITDVSVLQYPSGNGRDAEINNYALPILIQETLDQQGASIDMVSGATVTSVGYTQSLQSALDRAGL
ncbi:FMN-binding protein [Nocardioides sp.]|uniref:FMN-binding protein n=1 Tax=Nocardioides sp. TaxID=35761 RepID=UPI003D0F161D